MILTKCEQEIIQNMRYPWVRIDIVGKSYKDLSDDELISLIKKMDDYICEIGEIQRAFGNYDEFYILEMSSIKSRLINESQKRNIL